MNLLCPCRGAPSFSEQPRVSPGANFRQASGAESRELLFAIARRSWQAHSHGTEAARLEPPNLWADPHAAPEQANSRTAFPSLFASLRVDSRLNFNRDRPPTIMNPDRSGRSFLRASRRRDSRSRLRRSLSCNRATPAFYPSAPVRDPACRGSPFS